MKSRCWSGLAGLCVFLALVAAGCGPSGPKKVAVSGTVKYQGELLKEGTLVFRSEDPNGSSGGCRIDEDGSWSIPADKGLVPGKYYIQISSPRKKSGTFRPGGSMLEAEERLPEEYNMKSKLNRDVTEDGPNRFDFDLP